MFVENWTEFKKAAEKVYLQNPDKVNLKKPTSGEYNIYDDFDHILLPPGPLFDEIRPHPQRPGRQSH